LREKQLVSAADGWAAAGDEATTTNARIASAIRRAVALLEKEMSPCLPRILRK
jgi:hypothetical protein